MLQSTLWKLLKLLLLCCLELWLQEGQRGRAGLQQGVAPGGACVPRFALTSSGSGRFCPATRGRSWRRRLGGRWRAGPGSCSSPSAPEPAGRKQNTEVNKSSKLTLITESNTRFEKAASTRLYLCGSLLFLFAMCEDRKSVCLALGTRIRYFMDILQLRTQINAARRRREGRRGECEGSEANKEDKDADRGINRC